MTLILFLLLLQEPPALEATRAASIEEGTRYQLTVSRTGKFLVLGSSDNLDIFTAADLMPIKAIPRPWTAFAFDEKDEHLLIVNSDLCRLDTVEWKQQSREVLEGQEIEAPKRPRDGDPSLLPHQAWIAPDGSVYYRATKGAVARAVRKDGKLTVERLTETPDDDRRVRQIIGGMEQTPFLALTSVGKAGIVHNRNIYYLIASSHSLYAAPIGGQVVFVGESYEGLYDARTWKVKEHTMKGKAGAEEPERTRHDAVLDPKSGWVLVAEQEGLRARNTAKFEQESRYKQFTDPVFKVALDAPGRLLYTLEKSQIRRWKLAD